MIKLAFSLYFTYQKINFHGYNQFL